LKEKENMEHKYFGIIPARGGSKGIKNKNLQLIGNKPMIQYTFEASKNTSKVDYVILSSDDKKIINLARRLGIKVPFVRPSFLAQDDTPTAKVITHALEWYKEEYHNHPENLILLQPTSPFRTGEDINSAIEKYESSQKDSLISICTVSQHPSECLTISDSDGLEFINTGHNLNLKRRQLYKKCYFIDGAIYICKTSKFLENETMFNSISEIFILPKSHSIDVDDWFDLLIARAIKYYSERVNSEIFSY
jgi:CMP-N-acetylneuraminic acid synthetase